MLDPQERTEVRFKRRSGLSLLRLVRNVILSVVTVQVLTAAVLLVIAALGKRRKHEVSFPVLQEGSSRPHRLRTTFTDEGAERLKDLLHRSPRDFGKERGTWTLELAAQVSFEQGIIPTPVSDESVRRALKRLKTNWKRAKHWITSPDPQYQLKKRSRPADCLGQRPARLGHWLPGRGVVESLCLASHARLAGRRSSPASAGADLEKGDPDPKALACYGILWQRGPAEEPIRNQMSLRFVTGRPVSDITTQFLQWGCDQLQAQGKTAWLLIWDNTSWHVSKLVRTWIREHNSHVKAEGKGIRILPCFLPTKSPWLNPIEPKWVHGKRAVVEPGGLLSAKLLAQRICSHFGCSYEPHLVIPEKVA